MMNEDQEWIAKVERWRSKDLTVSRKSKVSWIEHQEGDSNDVPVMDCVHRCVCCQKHISIVGSTLGTITTRKSWARVVNPSSLNRPTEYLTRDGSLLHVDTIKYCGFPNVIKGRVCDDCVDRLDKVIYSETD